MVKLPESLTRFYGNPEYALECIALKEVTAIHVSLLNDPFDPNFTLNFEFGRDWKKFCDGVKHLNPSIIPTKESFDKSLQKVDELLTNFAEKTYVFSMFDSAGTEDNKLYMWGHYGNGHRGVALEFNTDALEHFFKEQDSSKFPGTRIFKISYDPIPVISCAEFREHSLCLSRGIDPVNTAFAQKAFGSFISKGKTWEKEMEWRFIIKGNEKTTMKIIRLGKLPEEAVSAVYFGYRTDKGIRENIAWEARKNFPKAKMYQAEKASGKIGLNIIDYHG